MKEINYTIPTKLSELSLQEYQRIVSVIKAPQEALTIEDRAKMFLSIWLPKEHLNLIKISELHNLYEKLLAMLNEAPKLMQKVEIDGVKYGFEPNLSEMNVGAYADIKTILEGGVEGNLHKVLAILYRPIVNEFKEYYEVETYTGIKGRDSVFLKHAKADLAVGAIGFFLTLSEQLSILLPHYLSQLTQKKA